MSLFRKILKLPKGGAAKPLNQSDVYATTIGSIYLFKNGQYGEGHTGQIYLRYIPSGATGFYANRV